MSEQVNYKRDDYLYAIADWELVSDVCEGERKIKAGKEKYLPIPNATDKTEENRYRYAQLLVYAVFYGATGRTLQGLNGAVFRKLPTFVAPTGLDYLKEDADGMGVSVYQQSSSVLNTVMKKARCALYVDYPNVEGGVSVADQQARRVQASIIALDPEQVINWRTEKVGGVHRLSMIVIEETVETPEEDGYGVERSKQYRELKIVDNVYVVEVYQENENGFELKEAFTPRNGSGQPWSVIPFTFVGATNNDSDIDESPLIDLARLNLAHYRNSADYEESVHMHGQPTPAIDVGDISSEEFNMANPDGIVLGARGGIILGRGGSATLLQMEANTAAFEAMVHKEKQMVALGARLVEKGQAVKTATQAQNESEVEHSVLSLAATNVSSAYTMAIKWVAEFQNVTGDIEYELNQEFAEANLEPQLLSALIQLWQSGKWTEADFFAAQRKFGLTEKSDEEIKDDLEMNGGGLGLDDAESGAA